MKIGILTFINSENAGTFLQAYSTVEALKKIMPNHQFELINISYRYRSAAPFWISIGRKRLINLPLAYEAYRKAKIARKLFSRLPLSKYYQIVNYKDAMLQIQSLNYDAIIVGSDEVLRLSPASDLSNKKEYPISWLSPEISIPKVLLASSAATLSWDDLNNNQQGVLSDSINSFKWLGVRDELTAELLSKANKLNQINRIPDPTFSLDIRKWQNKAKIPRLITHNKKPILAFRLPEEQWAFDLLDFFKKKGYFIVSLSGFFPGSYCLDARISLYDYPSVFSYFNATITSSFHECIFSLKNGVPTFGVDFYSHRKDKHTGRSKITSIIKDYGLPESHYIKPEMLKKDVEQHFQDISLAIDNFNREHVIKTSLDFKEKYLHAIATLKDLFLN